MLSSCQTNNSRSVALVSDSLRVPLSAGADASSSSTVVSLAAPTSLPAAPTLPAENFPNPAFLAIIVNEVKGALAAKKTLVCFFLVLFGVPIQCVLLEIL